MSGIPVNVVAGGTLDSIAKVDLVTGLGLPTDPAVLNPATEMSLISGLKGLMSITSSLATESTLNSVLSTLTSLNSKDFATQTTLNNVYNTLTARLPSALTSGGGVKTGLVDAVPSGDNTIGRVKVTDGTTVVSVDSSTQRLKVDAKISQAFNAIKTMVTGAKTVSTTAAALFAGASKLANRYMMIVYNEGTIPVYFGGSSVTTSSGFPILPGDFAAFTIDPTTNPDFYFIASTSTSVRVVEFA